MFYYTANPSLIEPTEVDMSRVVHFEFSAKDPEKAAGFFKNVFGWETTKWDGPGGLLDD